MSDEPLPPELHERMRLSIHSGIRRRSLRRKALGVVAIAAATVSLAAAAWVVLLPPGVRDRRATCYEATSTQARSVVSQYSFDDTIADPHEGAIENCAALWQGGVLHNVELQTAGTVPALALCSAPDLSFSVFPRPVGDSRSAVDFCADLGLLLAK